MDSEINVIEVYTDGSNKPNPGKSGSGIVICYPSGELKEILPDGFKKSTINRAELRACIQALKFIKKDPKSTRIPRVIIYSDSKHVVDGYKSLKFNKLKDFLKTADGGDRKNHVLWKDLRSQIGWLRKSVEIKKVEAHSGIEHNERANDLAIESREKRAYKIDYHVSKSKVRRWLNIPENNRELETEKNIIVFIQRTEPERILYEAYGQVLSPKINFGTRIKLRGILGTDILSAGHIYKINITKVSSVLNIKKISKHLGTPTENKKLISS